jgi:single-stranded DNA-specific DHH superfamily exonuclease
MPRKKKKKGVLVHHWDTDGICSGVILLEELAKEDEDLEYLTFTPRLGNYFLTEKEMEMFEDGGYTEMVIADMAIPTDQIELLSQWVGRIRHFDHHTQAAHKYDNVEHYNPVSTGKTQDDYPACTIVLMEHFKRELDLQTVLGVIGDLEHRVSNNKRYGKMIDSYMADHGLSFFDLMRAVELVDSNYKTDNRKAVNEAIGIMTTVGNDIGKIYSQEAWIERAGVVTKEINSWIKHKRFERDGYSFLRIKTRHHIISTVGRRLHRLLNKPIIVINTGFSDVDQIYIRGPDMTEAIRFSRDELGLRCGGKKDVLGAILEKGQLDDLLPQVIKKVPKK